jgi:hypothetical protein
MPLIWLGLLGCIVHRRPLLYKYLLFEAESLIAAEIDVNGQRVALAGREYTAGATNGKVRGYHEVRVLIDIAHFAGLISPVVDRVLDYTDSINPDVTDAETMCQCHGVLESGRDC